MADVVDRLDRFQRQHPVVGFPLAVVYKFFDDQGPYLATIITYYAFIAIFPLLLIASSILGFLLQGDTSLQDDIFDSALSQFPIVGSQLARPEGLRGSTSAVVVGTIAALYGVLGLGQASQNAMNVAWAIPRNSRLNPLLSRLRSLLLLLLGGLAVLVVAVVSSLLSNIEMIGMELGGGLRWLLTLVAVLLNAMVLTLLLRLATARRQTFQAALPGGVTIAAGWQLLQFAGGYYVSDVVAKASQVNGTFALVLGLIGLLYIASLIAVFGVEVNVVLAKRLYPRALLTPFTDAVDLTEADRRAYTEYAKAQRHKGFEKVGVTFLDNGNEPTDG